MDVTAADGWFHGSWRPRLSEDWRHQRSIVVAADSGQSRWAMRASVEPVPYLVIFWARRLHHRPYGHVLLCRGRSPVVLPKAR
jgi:hypothetical protein